MLTSTVVASIFLNKIFVISIDLVALFLAALVLRSNPSGRLNKLYLSMTGLMLGWVNFAYIPRALGPALYAYGVLSLRVSWLVTPLFFLSLYFLSLGLAAKEDRHRALTLATTFVATALSLASGFSNWVIAGFHTVDGVTTILYGPLKIPFLIGIGFVIVAMLAPLFAGGAVFKDKKLQAFSAGLLIFLVLNGIFNITLPMFLGVSRFYFLGDYSTLILLAFVAYAITNHRLFNTEVAAAEMISLFIWTGITVQLALGSTRDEQLLGAGTLAFALLFGAMLIRSVKREVAQREKIEALARELQETNERQETLIHFIGHEVKGFLTKAEGAFAALIEGDFGALPYALRPFVQDALAETREGVTSVSDILKAANQKKGTVSYVREPFDLKAALIEAVERARPGAEAKRLALALHLNEARAYPFVGDRAQLAEHVFRNLFENAIAYTPQGRVDVTLEAKEGKYAVSVRDTGIGIRAEDKPRLFTEGGHGKDSQKVNAHSTGYGLFIAKNVVLAEGGTIRAESDGPGQGSTFIVELPANA